MLMSAQHRATSEVLAETVPHHIAHKAGETPKTTAKNKRVSKTPMSQLGILQ
jgi:predicted metalloprotease